MVVTGWQLALIVLGSIWLGGMFGFFLCAMLTVAKAADAVSRRDWLETE